MGGLKTTTRERERGEEESDGRGKRQSGVPFVGWAKGMIASGPLPCVIADTARSTRAPDPLHPPFLHACLFAFVAASPWPLSLCVCLSNDRTHNDTHAFIDNAACSCLLCVCARENKLCILRLGFVLEATKMHSCFIYYFYMR